ncbi:bola protein [Nemania sp. NC0429]|nr:bola protein [Nemania sp. NC0429]
MFRRTTAAALSPAAPIRIPSPAALLLFPIRLQSTSTAAMASDTPMEDVIRTKVTEALSPSRLEIFNDSHKHAHHKPMQNSTSRETHFRLVITSDAFRAKMQPARHRLVYGLLRDEMAADGGIHALQLRTMTPEEEARQAANASEEGKA